MRIPDQIVDEVRINNDIVDVISEYVQLKKQGRSYKGLCPFHNEKSASFTVDKEKQLFHCFGCKASGNVISFIIEIETFNFVEAVRFLANKVNLSLPETKQKKSNLSKESQTLLKAYEWLTKYYNHFLRYSDTGEAGLLYFNEREITESTIERFELGFAPSDSSLTVKFLEEKGFHRQMLVKAGILSSRDNETYTDPFRGRVIFPIKNHLGKTVAFGGRSIHDEQPKYLNSPEHELFRKGNVLYNFDLAKNHIRKQNEVIVFEGYMDVLSADQTGIRNTIATLGTALTDSQAKTLRRYVDSVILCFDSDKAGIEGSYQAARLLHKAGCTVKIATVPDGKDPDNYIKELGVESFQNDVLAASDTYFKFMMNYIRRDFNLSVESERIAYIEQVTEQLAMIESQIEREYYINDVANEFNISKEIIQNRVMQHRKDKSLHLTTDNSARNSNTKHVTKIYQENEGIALAYQNAERKLLAYMLHNNYIIDKVQQELGINFNMEEHKVILTHLYGLYEEKNEVFVSDLINKLVDNNLKHIITEIAFIPLNHNNNEEEIEDYIQIIKEESTEMAQLRDLKEQQKVSVQQNNPILAAKLGLEIIEIEKKLKQ